MKRTPRRQKGFIAFLKSEKFTEIGDNDKICLRSLLDYIITYILYIHPLKTFRI